MNPMRAALAKARHVVPESQHDVVLGPPTKKRAKFPFVGTIELPGGIVVDVENRKGSFREGVDGGGTPWRVEMRAHYGEIRGTEGADGEPLDVYVGSNADSPLVVVVHQQDPSTGEYDEDKALIGFRTVAEALALYRQQYNRSGFYQDHTVLPITSFWRWVKSRELHGGKLVMKSADVTWVEVPERYLVQGTRARAATGVYVAESKPLGPGHRAASVAAEKAARAVILSEAAIHTPKANREALTMWGVSDDVLNTLQRKSTKVVHALRDYGNARHAEAKAERESTEKITAQPYPQGEERARLTGAMKRVVDAMKADGIFAGMVKAFLAGRGPMAEVLEKAKRWGGGPYIGPNGGKWADPEHTIHWKESAPAETAARDEWDDVEGRDRAVLSALQEAHGVEPVEAILRGVKHREFAVGLDRDGNIVAVQAGELTPRSVAELPRSVTPSGRACRSREGRPLSS